MITSIYNDIRRFLFSILVPAPSRMNRYTRNFIGIKQLIKLLPDYDQICHPVQFDFYGNMQNIPPDEWLDHNKFEAMIIGNFLEDKNIYSHNKQYIIFVGGNTTCFQSYIHEMIALYNKSDKNSYLIGFNPPGVGMSPGIMNGPEDYCGALQSIIDNLCNKGISPTEILVYGHSLGAGIGARTVAQNQLEGKNIRLFADRTMSTLAEAAGEKVRSSVPTYLLRNTLGSFFAFFIRSIVRIFSLDLDVAKDFTTINTKNPESAIAIGVFGDDMMEKCCLSNGLPQTQTKYFTMFKLRESDKSKESHCRVYEELIFNSTNGEITADTFRYEYVRKKIKF